VVKRELVTSPFPYHEGLRYRVHADPNLTNKRFPGNPTRSYRTRAPLRIVAEVEDWRGHPPEPIRQMLDHLEALRRAGRAVIDD